jgi:hypothetical protein
MFAVGRSFGEAVYLILQITYYRGAVDGRAPWKLTVLGCFGANDKDHIEAVRGRW